MIRSRLHAVALAAALFAAAPAWAQTNDPSLTQSQIDCLGANRAADCAAAGQTGTPPAGAIPGDVVPLPDLIVDLFPGPAGGALPGSPPLPAAAPRDPLLPPANLPPSAPAQAITGAFVPDEVLVTVDGDAAVVQDIAASFGLEVRSQRQSLLLGTTVARLGIPDGRPLGVVLAQLAGDGRTRGRVANHVYDLQQAAGVVNYAFQRIALDSASASGENVGVAVIDTAIDETHPALKTAIAGLFDAMPGVAVTARDHATSVAGLIAGTGPFTGIAPGAKIYHARAFEGGKSNTDIILAALDWAAGQDIRIVNMSFVGPANDLLESACAALRARKLVLVAAAGNNGPKAPYGYPAAYPGVIAVTATDDRDGLMPQANRGAYVYVAAPGVNLLAPIGGGSDLVTGTSFAAAVVSGAIANMMHAAPDRDADSIEKALAETAKDLGAAGRDADFGYGLLDFAAAVKQ